MNHSKLRIPIAILATLVGAGFLLFLLITWFSNKGQAAVSTPQFNIHDVSTSNNQCFKINLSGQNQCNIQELNGHREINFLRVTQNYDMSNDGHLRGASATDRLEVCAEEATVVYLWAYVHNSISTRHNHKNYSGTGVARNPKIAISSSHLNEDTYANRHTITANVSANNASSVSDTTKIYCDDHKIKIVGGQASSFGIHNWGRDTRATQADYSYSGVTYHERDNQAIAKFGPYGFGSGSIFDSGIQFGYGNGDSKYLPASRYYAAYMKIPITIFKEQPRQVCPEGQELVGETCEDKCPEGQTRVDGDCVDECPDGFILDEANSRCECPEGQELVGETCEDKCPEGQTRVDGTCQEKPPCPEGQELVGETCEDKCPEDQTRVDGTCQEKPPCPEGLILYEKTNECRCPAGQEMDKNDKCEIINTGILDDFSATPLIIGLISVSLLVAFSRLCFIRARHI